VRSLTEFTLAPAPPAGQRIVLFAAVEPSNTASGIDKAIADKYAKVLAMGARADLYAQTGKPYSNPAAALEQRAAFELEISEAKSAVGSGYSSAPVRVAAQFF
jgi:hypothetical protein